MKPAPPPIETRDSQYTFYTQMYNIYYFVTRFGNWPETPSQITIPPAPNKKNSKKQIFIDD